MKRLLLVAALGGALGFALTAHEQLAAACSCLGPQPWRLTLVDASAGVDRAAWDGPDINLRPSGGTEGPFWLTATDRYNLELEVK